METERSGVVFGSRGLSKVEYTGMRKAIIKGAYTGHRYEFGDGRFAAYVDACDLKGMLGLLDQDGQALFVEL